MSTKITASILSKAKDLSLIERDLPKPAANEVTVAIKATTLCGSDMHYYSHGANGDFKVREPLSLGHESAGVVTAVGSDVTDLKVGDKVAVEVGTPCGECNYCRGGRYNLCTKMAFRSSARSFPHYQGTLQDCINQKASMCYKLPENVSLEEGALIEPLAVAIHAVRRSQLQPGASVLVVGAGAVGLLCAAMARVSGAANITICDIAEGRVKFATENDLADAGYVVPLKRATEIAEKLELATANADELVKLNKGKQYDVTYECTGVESSVQTGIYATAAGGKLMFVGMGFPIQQLHIASAALREIDLLGVMRYANCYPTAVSLLEYNRLPILKKLITHKVAGLKNVSKAFELAGKPVDEDGKLVIKVMVEN